MTALTCARIRMSYKQVSFARYVLGRWDATYGGNSNLAFSFNAMGPTFSLQSGGVYSPRTPMSQPDRGPPVSESLPVYGLRMSKEVFLCTHQEEHEWNR